MKAGQDLHVWRFSSVGQAYLALQNLADDDDSSFDLIPGHDGAVLIVSTKQKPPPAVKEIVVSITCIPSVSGELLNAYLGLSNPPLEADLVVFETADVGTAFDFAHRLQSSSSLKLIDLRVNRGGSVGAVVLATGNGDDLPAISAGAGELTVVKSPNAFVRSLFEEQPKSF